jgi:protein ImuB
MTVTQPGRHDLADVIDRLRNRLGPKRVTRLAARESHWPERAAFAVPPLRATDSTAGWRQARLRPLQLLNPPERLEAMEWDSGSIDGEQSHRSDEPALHPPSHQPSRDPRQEPYGDETTPPACFRWRRSDYRVLRAEGPERIEPEWWRSGSAEARDYFWVQDRAGRRFWIYRSRGAGAGWYLHGLFA